MRVFMVYSFLDTNFQEIEMSVADVGGTRGDIVGTDSRGKKNSFWRTC